MFGELKLTSNMAQLNEKNSKRYSAREIFTKILIISIHINILFSVDANEHEARSQGEQVRCCC